MRREEKKNCMVRLFKAWQGTLRQGPDGDGDVVGSAVGFQNVLKKMYDQ